MRTASILLFLAAFGCAATRTSPVFESPVYELERGGEVTHWRYVPLSPRLPEPPSHEDFLRSAARCKDDSTCLANWGFYRSQCSDGLDNDGDALIDHPADPGCKSTHALEEAPACDDGRDNDRDGYADWDGAGFSHPDPECKGNPTRDRESPDRSRWPAFPFSPL